MIVSCCFMLFHVVSVHVVSCCFMLHPVVFPLLGCSLDCSDPGPSQEPFSFGCQTSGHRKSAGTALRTRMFAKKSGQRLMFDHFDPGSLTNIVLKKLLFSPSFSYNVCLIT